MNIGRQQLEDRRRFVGASLLANSFREYPQGVRRGCKGLALQQHTQQARSYKGFTLIELLIVIIIIATLMGFFMNRVMFYQEQAEKVAMESVAGAVQSALIIQYSQLLTHGKSSDVTALIQDNPMNWMQKKTSNYAGEFFDPTLQSAESGNWVFDLKTRDLVYLVRNGAHLQQGVDGKPWIRFHVTMQNEPSRLPSLKNAPPELSGIVFEPTQPYSWF